MGSLRARLFSVVRGYGQQHFSQPLCAELVVVRLTECAKPTGQIRNIHTNATSPSVLGVNCKNCFSFGSHQRLFSQVCIHNKCLPVRCFSSQNSGTNDLKLEEGSNTPSSGSGQEAELDTPSHSQHILHGQNNSGTTQILYEDQKVSVPRLDFDVSSHDVSSSANSENVTGNNACVVAATPYSPDVPDQQTALDSPRPDTMSTPREPQDLQDLPPPRPMEPSYNLAPYVAKSEVLQRLVGLGVDLSVIEKVSEAADFVVQANWDADIQPRLLFLRDVGVEDVELGHVLTKNPLLLKEDVEDMQVNTATIAGCNY